MVGTHMNAITIAIDQLVEYDARTETIQYHSSDLIEEFRQVCSSS